MSRYIDTAEVAKMIRRRLKAAFPLTKFSVRISRYAGGSSIDIGWFDGPTGKQVDAITGQYSGKGFDGMIDMEFGYDHWLLPDGSAVVAYSPGTEGSRGVYSRIEATKPHADAELVHFGSGYVHTNRRYSPAFFCALVEEYAAKWGRDGLPAVKISEYDGSAYLERAPYEIERSVYALAQEKEG